MMKALVVICGTSIRRTFQSQQILLKHLKDAALEIKTCKDTTRNVLIQNQMETLNLNLREMATPLPLSLGWVASGMEIKKCSYFSSNTFPLRLTFMSNASFDPSLSIPPTIQAMYKIGDDLRQDQLTIQMIRIMDKLWLKEGLDLKIVTFGCVPTGDRQGMVELVTNSKTLREIQVMGNRGVTGAFNQTPIYEYLTKYNPSQYEFARAVNNFTRSCAGYCVITYILGICDRHNDNIMVKESGHLFHIGKILIMAIFFSNCCHASDFADFGKFLGDAQTFGTFKRDRAPFVLTPDMVYVINGGDKPTQKYQDFVDLCCKSFNIIRQNGNSLFNFFALVSF